LLIFNGFGIWTLIFSILLQHFVGMIFYIYYAKKYKWLPNFNFNLSSVSGMIRFGAHRIVSSVLHQIYSRADQITIGALLGPSALGIYSVAYNLSMQPFLRINPILTQISFPVFSRITSDSDRILRAYRKGLRVLIFINAPLLLGMLATASLIVPIVLGPGWGESVLILQILCIYGLLRSSGNINTGLIIAFEKYQWPTYWNLFLLFFTPLAIFVAYQIKDSLIMVTFTVLLVEFFLAIVSYFLFSRRLLGGFGMGYLNDLGKPFFCFYFNGYYC
jgi:O-antigen/teichoic acid export membrane protein